MICSVVDDMASAEVTLRCGEWREVRQHVNSVVHNDWGVLRSETSEARCCERGVCKAE